MQRRFMFVLLATVVAVAGFGGSAARASSPAMPRLQLRSASDSVTLYRYGHERVQLDLGLYLQSIGADFQLNVTRVYGKPIQVNQVTGATERPLPGWVADNWEGINGLFRYKVRDAEGNVVWQQRVSFCPDTYDMQRIDQSGPLVPTFPQYCSDNPFTLGMVWGIDKGWAAPLADYAPSIKLPTGHYTITVRISQRYADLFGITHPDAVRTVSAVVKKAAGGGCPPFCGGVGRRARTKAPDETPTAAPTVMSPNPATEPDLVALPAWGIDVNHHGRRDAISFGATVWDRGPAPMVVEGYRRPNSDIMDAYEYFFRNGKVIGRAPAGTMVYDARPGHEHWHFEQFARYTLLGADRSEVVRSRKEAFCLAPTDAIDLTVPNALWDPYSVGLEGACGDQTSIWTRETLPVGWGDTYFQYLPGQSFNITGLPNGTYYIRIQANPDGVLHEVSTTNDTQLRKVILGGTRGHRTIVVPPWHGIHA